jgi:hypothetical protein
LYAYHDSHCIDSTGLHFERPFKATLMRYEVEKSNCTHFSSHSNPHDIVVVV